MGQQPSAHLLLLRYGDLCRVLGAVAEESDFNAGDYISYLLQAELNEAVVNTEWC